MYNYKIKTSFISPEMPNAWAKKLVLIFMIVHLYIRRKLDDRHSFFVWMRTGSNPPDINWY